MPGGNGAGKGNVAVTRAGADRWARVRNILGVRLDSIGDVLMTTPAIRAVRESLPEGKITLLTSPSGAETARMVPEIDEVLVYQAPWMKATAPAETSLYDRRIVDNLQSLRFDGAIIFTVYSQNPLAAAFLCYLADIPLRLGYSRENPYLLLTDWQAEQEPFLTIRHEVMRQLDLVASVGFKTTEKKLSLSVPEEAMQSVSAILKEIGIGNQADFVIIHAGATAPSRRYPAEGFSALSEYCVSEMGLPVLFTGTGSERDLIETVRSHMRAPSVSLAGRLSLPELAALVRRAKLLVTNNTGPAHIAAALGVPVVSLYALTNPQHTPWLVPNRVLFHDVPCKYCYKSICPHGHHDCLRLVSPSQVKSAIVELLGEDRTTGRRLMRASSAPQGA